LLLPGEIFYPRKKRTKGGEELENQREGKKLVKKKRGEQRFQSD